jgi:hypothetical protein
MKKNLGLLLVFAGCALLIASTFLNYVINDLEAFGDVSVWSLPWFFPVLGFVVPATLIASVDALVFLRGSARRGAGGFFIGCGLAYADIFAIIKLSTAEFGIGNTLWIASGFGGAAFLLAGGILTFGGRTIDSATSDV